MLFPELEPELMYLCSTTALHNNCAKINLPYWRKTTMQKGTLQAEIFVRMKTNPFKHLIYLSPKKDL